MSGREERGKRDYSIGGREAFSIYESVRHAISARLFIYNMPLLFTKSEDISKCLCNYVYYVNMFNPMKAFDDVVLTATPMRSPSRRGPLERPNFAESD